MKKLLRLGFFLIAIIFLVSCDSKDEPVTDIGVIQKELQTVIKDNSITKCSVIYYYSNFPTTEYSNCDFSISNGSLIITSQYPSGRKYEHRFNLLYLSNYEYSDNYISFYFSNIHN